MATSFTSRAEKVMQLANQEARRFNHEYIGTKHILLGLVKEGSGIAAGVLKSLDVDLRRIRVEVERIVQSGPDMVTMATLPQTPRAKKVIEYAILEARNLDDDNLGTEHILLGLLLEQEGVAAQVLINLGLTLEDVRHRVLWSRHVIDPSWLKWNDCTVPNIACAIAESRHYCDLPILADALEEAGCTDGEILGHLRQPGNHICANGHLSGCWVLDLLLGLDPRAAVNAESVERAAGNPESSTKRWWQFWR